MVKCGGCKYNEECAKVVGLSNCTEYQPKTRADKIRQMSDEELAEFLTKNQKIGDIEQHKDGFFRLWLDWLKEEVKDNESFA